MTLEEAKAVLQPHLVLCDIAGRQNTSGGNLFRDAATAIRFLLAKAEASE